MITFREVERPAIRRGGDNRNPVWDAIAAQLRSGKTLHITATRRQAVAGALGRRGLTGTTGLHIVKSSGGFTAWVES